MKNESNVLTCEGAGKFIRTQAVRIIDAIAFAQKVHRDQVDKGGQPYLWHLMRVGVSLLPNLRAAVVGVLHDVLEDTETNPEVVREFLSDDEMWEALLAVTHKKGEPYWDYIRRCSENPMAVKVKLADLRDNADPNRLAEVARREGPAEAQRLRERYAVAVAQLSPETFRMTF